MNVYLASGFRQRYVLRKAALALVKLGHKIVSSWIWLETRPDRGGADFEQFAVDIAKQNLDELRQADVVIVDSFGIAPDNKGGVHTELGFALGAGKDVFLVGPPGNTFHWLPQIARADDWEDFFAKERLFPLGD